MPIFTKRKFKKASVGSTFIAIAMVVTAGASTPLAAQVASALPNVCTQPLSATNMQGVANFIWAGCPQLLKWPHDTAPRMSGPNPNGNGSVHGFVLNYYAPSVYEWLKAGRPQAGIPSGAIIIKQMYADNNGTPGNVNGWTVMVKKIDASYDGWLWGYVDPQNQNQVDGAFGGEFFDPNCVGCHASASTRQLTFSSLVNIAPNFGGTSLPLANGLMAGTLHARAFARAPLAAASPVAATSPQATSKPPTLPPYIPPQSQSIVNVGPHGAVGFVTSDVCSGCHDASNLANGVQANMTWPQNVPPAKRATTPLTNFSPFGEWGASMMGLASRDPVFQAQRESETLLYPSVAKEIDNTCYTCHGVMGKRQLTTDKPNALFTHQDFLATSGPMASYGALARDGVSCLACHRMLQDGLGTPQTFTGNFKVGDPKTVFGPYKDVVTFPMQNSVDMKPVHGVALNDPAMCGSCHVVETEILDKNKTYDRQSFYRQKKSHEQTTYLEWLNSRFQTKAPARPGDMPKTCQDCHMPRHIEGKQINTKIANIQDNTYTDAQGKPFPNTAPASEITMTERKEYGRHTFVGANVFVLEMFKQFGVQLGLTQGDRNYDLSTFKFKPRLDFAIEETTKQMQNESANLRIIAQRRSVNSVEVDVEVVNKAGHKFPSGVGFRRAFIEFNAIDASGKVLWSSGRSNDRGVILDAKGKPLETEFSKRVWQPHWRIVSNENQVQIYEVRTKDLQGLLTTSFLGLAKQVKDNRLMPQGWQASGPYADWTMPVAVPKTTNPGYYNGAGNNVVTYRIPAAIAKSMKSVSAQLHYQSIPPYYLQDRFDIGGNHPSTSVLRELVNHVDYSNTSAKGWKLTVAKASAAAQ
jgi:hypothetical protein